MAKAVLCPVCGGGGWAGDWLMGLPVTTSSKCWGCGGKGWVEVEDLSEQSTMLVVKADESTSWPLKG